MQLAPVAPARAVNTGAVNLGELRAAGKDGELRAVNTGAAVNLGELRAVNLGGTPRRIRRAGLLYRRRGQLRAANTGAAVNLGELRAGYAARDCFTAAVANSAPPIPPPPSTWGNSAPPAKMGNSAPPWPTPRRQSGGNSAPDTPRRQHHRAVNLGGTPRRRGQLRAGFCPDFTLAPPYRIVIRCDFLASDARPKDDDDARNRRRAYH